MVKKSLFDGLIIDETDQPVEVSRVGDEPCYVINDQGFKRHIPSENVDRQVLKSMLEMIEGHEEIITSQTAQMLGQDDPFTRAMIINQLKQMNTQLENLFQTGIPEETRAYLGMLGFKIKVNIHGEVIDIKQPGASIQEDE